MTAMDTGEPDLFQEISSYRDGLWRLRPVSSTGPRANLCHLGERTKDSPHLLQGQGLQEAHPAQGHPVQGWKGMLKIPLLIASSKH